MIAEGDGGVERAWEGEEGRPLLTSMHCVVSWARGQHKQGISPSTHCTDRDRRGGRGGEDPKR